MKAWPFARRVVVACWLLACAGPAGPVSAAGPSPAPGASGRPVDASLEIWQDEPLPPDIPAGRSIEVAFTTWDTRTRTLSRLSGADVRAYPATGKAAPTESTTHSDWPGHLLATITVPKGGLGRIEIGYPSQECHDDGTCVPIFMPFQWGGVGPPAEAPRSLLVEATIHPPADLIVPGQPVAIAADVTPRAAWDPAALALPDGLEVIARTADGIDLASAALQPAPGSAAPTASYSGTIAIPETRDPTLVLAFPAGPGRDREVIDRSVIRVRLAASQSQAAQPSTPPGAGSPAAPPANDLPVVPIVVGAAVVIAIVLGGRRLLADL